MPSMSFGDSPASSIALTEASSCRAATLLPEPRLYCVSPMPVTATFSLSDSNIKATSLIIPTQFGPALCGFRHSDQLEFSRAADRTVHEQRKFHAAPPLTIEAELRIVNLNER